MYLYVCVIVFGYWYDLFFVFKQKTAYEMRISDWSSDVCSSDLCSSIGGIFACRPRQYVAPAARSVDVNAGISHSGSRTSTAIAASGASGRSDEIGRASCRGRVCQYV